MRPAIVPGHPGAAFAPPSANGQMENHAAPSPGAFALHQPRALHPLAATQPAGVGGAVCGGMQPSAQPPPGHPGMVPPPQNAGAGGRATPDQASVAAALAAAQQFFGFMHQGGGPGGFHAASHGAFGAPVLPEALHRPGSAAALAQLEGLGPVGGHVHQLLHPHPHHLGGDITMGGTQSRGPTPGLHAADMSAAAYNRKDKR